MHQLPTVPEMIAGGIKQLSIAATSHLQDGMAKELASCRLRMQDIGINYQHARQYQKRTTSSQIRSALRAKMSTLATQGKEELSLHAKLLSALQVGAEIGLWPYCFAVGLKCELYSHSTRNP